MSASPRRIVALITLPATYNPDARGRRVNIEDEKFEQTMEDVATRFGGGVLWRFERETPRGYWWDRGIMYSDELAAVEVDIPDESRARSWLVAYARRTLLHHFQQEAIYVRFIGPIEVETVTVA